MQPECGMHRTRRKNESLVGETRPWMALRVVSAKIDSVLQTADCAYYTPASLGELSFADGLAPYLPPKCDILPARVAEM